MQYMLTFNEPKSEFAKRENPETVGEYWGAWGAYMGAIAEAGIMGQCSGSATATHSQHTARQGRTA